MRSRQGLWALSALVQSLYPRAAAAQNVEDCDQMGGTYTASIHEFTTKCDTSSVNGNIFAYYSDGDTFANCIDRCDAVDICLAALYLAGSGDCALLNTYQGDRPFNGNDLAIKVEAATTSSTDISTTDVSTTDAITTDATTTDATTTDATTTDATTTDVTTTDVTTTDVTTTDVTTTDVSTTDASTTDISTDASTTDASTTDASTTTASDAQTTTLSTTDSTTASDTDATTTSQTTSQSSDTSSTQSTTSIVQTSEAPTSPSASSTPARNIPVVDDYIYTGCLSSREGYPSFVGVATDPQMTTEKCIKLAAGSKYIGVYQESCYKADSLSETEPVADERCDLLCPGDHSLFCGGNTGDGRRLFGRAVAATRLLTLYRQKVASVSSASLSTIVTDSKTVPAYDSTITKTASAGHLTVSCSTASDEASTSTELAKMVTTVTYATINPTNPAGLITTCVPITLLYSPCHCEHQVYPSVDMTTVTYTQASDTITLTIPKAALETGSQSDTPHPIIQYPSASWNENHRTDAASGGYSMAQPTAGGRENSQSDTPTNPSQPSGSGQGQGSSEPHDAPDATIVVVTAEASRLQLHFWIATIAIMGLVMG